MKRIILTDGQKSELAHGYHLDHESGFDSEKDERKVWEQHKLGICQSFCPIYRGRMPDAWWKYDVPGDFPEKWRGFFGIRLNVYESEHDCIVRLGLLEKARALGYQNPKIRPADSLDDLNDCENSFLRGYP